MDLSEALDAFESTGQPTSSQLVYQVLRHAGLMMASPGITNSLAQPVGRSGWSLDRGGIKESWKLEVISGHTGRLTSAPFSGGSGS